MNAGLLPTGAATPSPSLRSGAPPPAGEPSERWGSRIRERFNSDNAAVLPLVAGALVFLLGVAAFGLDLGWFYLNTIRIQRSADAAALGGVIHMPGFFSTAESVAWDLAAKNGHTNGVGGAVVTPEPVPGEPHQLKVTVSDTVETFFLRVFGMDQVTIVKEGIGEYVLPLPLGSPENHFGIGTLPGGEDFWAAIQGPYTKKEHGDPFATQCLLSFNDNNCGSGGSSNGEYRPRGYYYGVEVPLGSSISQFQVQIYDAGFYHRGSVTIETGDFRWSSGGQCPGCSSSTAGATMTFTQYDTDATPLDPFDNPVACNRTMTPEDTSPYTENLWLSLCTFSVSGPTDVGIYPLQVQTTGTGHAMSMYGVRACAPSCSSPSGDQPRVFGIFDISIWVNNAGATPEFFFAEVDDVHAGKDFEIRLFDPGDAAANVTNFMTLIGPDDTAWPTCNYEVVSWKTGGIEDSGTASPCTINATRTTTNCGTTSSPEPACKYNGDWLTINVTIPATYTCDPAADPSTPNDCWWKIRYNYGGSVNDRTTWSARILGNPVHLVLGG